MKKKIEIPAELIDQVSETLAVAEGLLALVTEIKRKIETREIQIQEQLELPFD